MYENTTLKWSAHLDFLPIAISRASLKEVKGALVLLGEEGRLECCYLGTEPSFFVAPPLNLQEIDFAQAEKELENLEKILSSYSNNGKSLTITLTSSVNNSFHGNFHRCLYAKPNRQRLDNNYYS